MEVSRRLLQLGRVSCCVKGGLISEVGLRHAVVGRFLVMGPTGKSRPEALYAGDVAARHRKSCGPALSSHGQ